MGLRENSSWLAQVPRAYALVRAKLMIFCFKIVKRYLMWHISNMWKTRECYTWYHHPGRYNQCGHFATFSWGLSCFLYKQHNCLHTRTYTGRDNHSLCDSSFKFLAKRELVASQPVVAWPVNRLGRDGSCDTTWLSRPVSSQDIRIEDCQKSEQVAKTRKHVQWDEKTVWPATCSIQ